MIPLYGFLEGDTLGLLVLVGEQDTAAELARKLQDAAALRVAPAAHVRVWVRGEPIAPAVTVSAAGLQALDRFDVRFDLRSNARADARRQEREP
ncbi:MAG TPA: toluene-4-monooxygenase system B family protein [Polyangia bacterium]